MRIYKSVKICSKTDICLFIMRMKLSNFPYICVCEYIVEKYVGTFAFSTKKMHVLLSFSMYIHNYVLLFYKILIFHIYLCECHTFNLYMWYTNNGKFKSVLKGMVHFKHNWVQNSSGTTTMHWLTISLIPRTIQSINIPCDVNPKSSAKHLQFKTRNAELNFHIYILLCLRLIPFIKNFMNIMCSTIYIPIFTQCITI